jgi:ABC-type multidrug transport system ATPase subunit
MKRTRVGDRLVDLLPPVTRTRALDEPLAYVDELSARIIGTLLVTLVDRGVLVVVSSHDPTLGLRLNARTIRLRQGRLVQESEPRESDAVKVPETSVYAIL